MKRNMIALASLLLIGTLAFTVIDNWKMVSETAKVKFSMMAHGNTLNGSFSGLKGDARFDEKDLANSYIKASIDVKTVNSGVGGRDKHLQAPDFFDVAKYPTIDFTSKKVEKTDDGFVATGDLKIRDVTKEIAIVFTFANKGNEGVFNGTFKVNRQDFGVGKANPEIGDEITISLDVPVAKQ
jgi:polyisoprenoid-binding protein YceI